MEYEKKPSLWPLASLGIIVSVLAFFLPKRNQSRKIVHPRDTTHNEGTPAVIDVPLSHADPIKTTGGKNEPEKRDWVKISAIAQACAIPLGFGLLCVNFYQVKTMRQQLESTSAAIVRVNGISFESFPPPIGSTIYISVEFRNEGIAIAGPVNVHARMGLFHVADKSYKGAQVDCGGIIPRIVHETNEYTRCKLVGLSSEELTFLQNMDDTIALEGEFSYWDGFFKTTPEQICYRYQPALHGRTKLGSWSAGDDRTLIPCVQFDHAKDNIANSLDKPTR